MSPDEIWRFFCPPQARGQDKTNSLLCIALSHPSPAICNFLRSEYCTKDNQVFVYYIVSFLLYQFTVSYNQKLHAGPRPSPGQYWRSSPTNSVLSLLRSPTGGPAYKADLLASPDFSTLVQSPGSAEKLAAATAAGIPLPKALANLASQQVLLSTLWHFVPEWTWASLLHMSSRVSSV